MRKPRETGETRTIVSPLAGIVVLLTGLLIIATSAYLHLRSRDAHDPQARFQARPGTRITSMATPPPTYPPSGTSAPVPGVPITLEPITINLRDGHFLKLGLALQPVAGLPQPPDGATALDIANTLFSGLSIDDLSSAEGREAVKAQFVAKVKVAYQSQVYTVYFTTFVMQYEQ